MFGERSYLCKSDFCVSCLCHNDEIRLSVYGFRTETFKSIFQVDQVVLCYICNRLAQRAERFIESVQNNQALLKGCDVTNTTLHEALKLSSHQPITLLHTNLDSVNFDGKVGITDTDEEIPPVNIKTEPEFLLANDKELVCSVKFEDDDCADNPPETLEPGIKEDDDYPLELLKEELESEGITIQCIQKSTKKRKKKKGIGLKKNGSNLECLDTFKDAIVERIEISEAESLEERAQKRLQEDYQNKIYKCDDCVKGFTYKDSFDHHMELHAENKGDFECDICKIRQPSENRMRKHKHLIHLTRYRCRECGLVRNNHKSIEDHYLAIHAQSEFMCRYCSKVFKRRVSLKKHVSKAHEPRKKVQCDYCNKYYACKETLKHHVNRQHLDLIPGAKKKLKCHSCQVCGASFSAPSQLNIHLRVHSHSKDYYCVECDKSFKTETSLVHHLKTTKSHAQYSDLPFHCAHCEKRFAIKRDLARHMNRVHLNIKPFQCDQCEKAYINNWSLREHRRLAHEGYIRPRQYPCDLCEKIFDRGHILKAHKRTHTGERPYQCSKCPASFSQAGVLGTHYKLIHLRLTRDGRPKAAVK